MQHNSDRLLHEMDQTSPFDEVITGFGCLAARSRARLTDARR
jgi:hypothetical protein